MPILMLGYLLACFKLSEKRSRRPASTILIQIPPPKTLPMMLKGFTYLMEKNGASALKAPTDADRQRFGFNESDWGEFVRRLGFGDGDGEASSGASLRSSAPPLIKEAAQEPALDRAALSVPAGEGERSPDHRRSRLPCPHAAPRGTTAPGDHRDGRR